MKYFSIDQLKRQYENHELTKGFYSSQNENGDTIVVMVYETKGFAIQTMQPNGWVRINEYLYEDGHWTYSEIYEGNKQIMVDSNKVSEL